MTDEQIRAFSQQIARLPALSTLASEEYRDASSIIEELVEEIKKRTAESPFDFALAKALVEDLRRIGDPSAAEIVAERGAGICEELGREVEAVDLLNWAGVSCFNQCEFLAATEYFQHALRLIPEDDQRFQEATVCNNYGIMLSELDHFSEASSLYTRALKLLLSAPRDRFVAARGVEPEAVIGTINNNRGWIFLRKAKIERNDPDLLTRAIQFLEQTLESSLQPRTRVIAAGNLAEAYLLRGDDEVAEEILSTLEEECLSLKLQQLLTEVYRRKGQLCAAREEMDQAMVWLRKALQSSLTFTNPRQELRAVEEFFRILGDLMARDNDRLAVLEGAGASVLNELLDLLKSKDMYTGHDHSRRVASLSRRMASFAKAEGRGGRRWLKRVELGGLLHDVGKLMIPWSLLNRIRPLSPREVKQLQRHPLVGEELLARLGLHELAMVVGEHHERPDGMGYPRGKAGLSDAGAIVAVADAYEAMTSPSRAYRQPKRPRQAITEVLTGSGRQFDPKAVEALSHAILNGELGV